jgi:hypothetical protein
MIKIKFHFFKTDILIAITADLIGSKKLMKFNGSYTDLKLIKFKTQINSILFIVMTRMQKQNL